MRVNRITCPKCNTTLTSKAGIEAGATIACPKCRQKFAVAAEEEEEQAANDFDFMGEEDEAPKKKPQKPLARKPADDDEDEERPKAKKRLRDDDEDEERPKAKKRLRDDDEDEERPKAKKRLRDDDNDDRPRKKKKKRRDEELSAYGKLKGNIWVRVAVFAVLFAGLGVAIWLRWGREKKEEPQEPDNVTNVNDDMGPIRPDQLRKFPKVENKTPANDLSKFQGAWKATSVSLGGMQVPAGGLSKLDWTVSGDQVATRFDPSDIAKIKLDATKNPREIDFTDRKNEVNRGIYRFVDNDTLEVCSNSEEGPRPTQFAAPPGSKIMLVIMKRGKK